MAERFSCAKSIKAHSIRMVIAWPILLKCNWLMAGDYDGRLINGYLSLPFLLERSSERRRKIAQTENRKKTECSPHLNWLETAYATWREVTHCGWKGLVTLISFFTYFFNKFPIFLLLFCGDQSGLPCVCALFWHTHNHPAMGSAGFALAPSNSRLPEVSFGINSKLEFSNLLVSITWDCSELDAGQIVPIVCWPAVIQFNGVRLSLPRVQPSKGHSYDSRMMELEKCLSRRVSQITSQRCLHSEAQR